MHFKTIDEGRSHKRELWIDDETNVAHLYVIDLPMRIGHAEIQMAGIGDVYTRREHRMKGYMRILYDDTVTYMADEGYDVSMLFGIPDFYTKFGYAACLPKCSFTIKTRDAEAAVLEMDASDPRPIEPADMPAVLELYAAENARRTGTLIRTPEQFTRFAKGTHWGVAAESALWENASGEVLAYLVWDRRPTEVRVAELGVSDPRAFPTLLRFLAEQAVTKRCEAITLHLPPDHAFSEFAQQFGITWEIEYPRYSDGMMRVLNQVSLFQKIAPVLTDRLAARPVAWLPDALSLDTDLGVTTLTFEDGVVSVGEERGSVARVSLSQDKLMQLLMGYRSARDLLNTPDVVVASAVGTGVLPLLDVLFPKGVPFVWTPDYF